MFFFARPVAAQRNENAGEWNPNRFDKKKHVYDSLWMFFDLCFDNHTFRFICRSKQIQQLSISFELLSLSNITSLTGDSLLFLLLLSVWRFIKSENNWRRVSHHSYQNDLTHDDIYALHSTFHVWWCTIEFV